MFKRENGGGGEGVAGGECFMNEFDKQVFLRSFKLQDNNSYDLFLGSGASTTSGIPSGNDLTLHFKREILSSQNQINNKAIYDLKIEANRKKIESFFDDTNIGNPYAHYFQQCYPYSDDRKNFLTNIVRDKKPSIGFLCTAALVGNNKFNTIWTTNFDDLIEKAINTLDYKSCTIISPENAASVKNYRDDIPQVVKLHGDFRYDPLQNTKEELQNLENNLYQYFVSAMQKKGLLVIGYSGNDESIIKTLRKILEEPNPFPKGLIWCIPRNKTPSNELQEIINLANQKNGKSGFMKIDTFDYFLYELYSACEINNININTIAKDRFETRKSFNLAQSSTINAPILLNAIKATSFPKTFFQAHTNIVGEGKWRKLREIVEGKNIVASFANKDTLSIWGDETEIKKVLANYLTDELKLVDVQERLLSQPDSFYLGMLYDLIEKSFVNDFQLMVCKIGRKPRKIYSMQHPITNEEIQNIQKRNKNFIIPANIQVYESFEFKVESVNSELFVLIHPNVHCVNEDMQEVHKIVIQNIVTSIISNRYNGVCGEKLNFWFRELKKRNPRMMFNIGGFEIKLSDYYSTAGKAGKDNVFSFNKYSKLNEPFIYFHHQDLSKKSIHPLNGLKMLGTLENSLSINSNPSEIKVAIIVPEFGFVQLKNHLEALLNPIVPKSEVEYLTEYQGFSKIYNKHLIIPQTIQNEFVLSITNAEVDGISAIQFYDLIKRKIDKFAAKNTEIDCVVIYIPRKWEHFRELKNENIYYDLHDSLKLYAVKKGLKIQFIEDKSIQYFDQAKVRWWLSLGIYVKSNGTPWKICTESSETAFVGLGYAVKQNTKNSIVLGSCQIFDGNGNGLKFLLQPIEKPIFYNKNPFMSKDDAFRLVNNIRNTYHKIDPVIGLKKLVLHKTTHFTRDEIDGICNALEGIENIELLQIQLFSYWKAIKLCRDTSTQKHKFFGYPIERGTIIQLDNYSFLLWTHGLIENQEIQGKYYQSKRGIPSPLLIKRFRGTDPIETVASDILNLTKMNWNGAELYKTLPVTIDFSKRLSIMGKQLEELGSKAYDFRYFI
jgi:hypothetical protein